MLSIKGRIAAHAFSALPIETLSGWADVNLVIPYYHIVRDNEVAHIKHLYKHKNVKQFSEDIDYLLKNYRPIDTHELLQWVRGEREIRERSFIVTFDDGLREVYEEALPILNRKGVPAIIFITSSFLDNKVLGYDHKASILKEEIYRTSSLGVRKDVERVLLNAGIRADNDFNCLLRLKAGKRQVIDDIARTIECDFDRYLSSVKPYMTSEEVTISLSSGFGIGAHSVDHANYVDLAIENQLEQTLTSMKIIKGNFHLDYGLYAFPYSSSGITKELIDAIYKSKEIDVTFGTAGLGHTKQMLQRINMENPILNARKTLSLEYARELLK